MTAIQIERDGQRVWINIDARDWPPASLPALITHITRAVLSQNAYNSAALQNQLAALLRGWTPHEATQALQALFAHPEWWRASYALWSLSQLQHHPEARAAVRARLCSLPMHTEEALGLGRWLVQSSRLEPGDEAWLRALYRAGNLDALRCALQGLSQLGALSAEDIDAGRRALFADPPLDPSFYTLSAIMQTLGNAEALRDDDYITLLSCLQAQRFSSIVFAVQSIGPKARGALDTLTRIFREALNTNPPQLAHNVIQAIVHVDKGDTALACLEALVQHPQLWERTPHAVCAWIRMLKAPSRSAKVWALLNRLRTDALIGNFYLVGAAFETEHPQAVPWFVEGLTSVQAPFSRAWLDILQGRHFSEAQRLALACALLSDAPAALRSWRRGGALVLLGAQHLDAQTRALLIGRWSEAQREVYSADGRRLPRAPRKKRLTHEALTIAVAIHESLQDPARAESAARALARWVHVGPQSEFKPQDFYNTLNAATAGILRALPQPNLSDPVFDALSRALCALAHGLAKPPKDTDPLVMTACQTAHKTSLDALRALYADLLRRLRDTHPTIDRLCHLAEAQDPDARSELAAALSRHALPAALAQALAKPLEIPSGPSTMLVE